ncbi:hypothetical protein HPP92_028206 [Vanilla planifolia]|uniref:Uncharacterized protein n=1 Tax=Vanilla planifolia TaxID=51239 RepID=A0A835U6A7_VANPL|nr:hypothetical protein HPP92_028206 [Vanilla planifolia]
MKKAKSIRKQNGHSPPFTFGKLLDPEASWDKDQLGDVLHWIRKRHGGLVCGVIWERSSSWCLMACSVIPWVDEMGPFLTSLLNDLPFCCEQMSEVRLEEKCQSYVVVNFV